MQAGQTNYIPLTPPLACFLNDRDFGWVIGMNQDSIIAKSHSEECSPLPFALKFKLSHSGTHQSAIVARAHQLQTDGTYLAKVDITSRDDLNKFITQTRKNQHIEICQTQNVESSDGSTGFERISLMPCALPDLRWDDIDTTVRFLNYKSSLPILITGMTGGVEKGTEINRRLAKAAQVCGIPMGVGSQRIALDHAECESIFQIRKWAPDVFIIANLGISQLRDKNAALDLARRAIAMIDANAIAIHLNILQELVQTEGDRDFSELWESIAHLQAKLDVPLIIKEVGCGIDLDTAQRLCDLGIRCFDVGGRGGTSWSYIESKRAKSVDMQTLGETFRDWGIPTANALAALANKFNHSRTLDSYSLIATGGLRNGLQIAKAVGLGANMCGVGLPFFQAALVSTESVVAKIQQFEAQLKVAMLASNSAKLSDLARRLVVGQPYQDAIEHRIQNQTTVIKKLDQI